jgi:hypothetical protein
MAESILAAEKGDDDPSLECHHCLGSRPDILDVVGDGARALACRPGKSARCARRLDVRAIPKGAKGNIEATSTGNSSWSGLVRCQYLIAAAEYMWGSSHSEPPASHQTPQCPPSCRGHQIRY